MNPSTLLLLAALPVHASAACPTSRFQLDSQPEVYTSAPTGSGCYLGPNYIGFNESCLSFSIPAGNLYGTVQTSVDASASARIVVVDNFDLVGVPPGTTAHLLVNLALDGYVPFVNHEPHGSVYGAVQDSMGHGVDTGPFSTSLNTTLSLPEDFIAGQPFPLTFSIAVSCHGDAYGTLDGTFSFSNVPSEASVVSCNGYVSNPVVASRPTSWGKLKALYR